MTGGKHQLDARHLRGIVESLRDALVVVAPDGRLLHASAAADALIGECAPGQSLEEYLGDVQLASDDGEPLSVAALVHSWMLDQPFRGKHITWRWPGEPARALSLSGGPVHDGSGRLLSGVMVARDVTERRQQRRDQECVTALARALVEDLSLDGVVQRIDDEGCAALEASAAVILLATGDGSALEVLGGRLGSSVGDLPQRLPVEADCVCTRAFRSGELQTVEDLARDGSAEELRWTTDDRLLSGARRPRSRSIRSLLAVPLLARGARLGILLIAFAEARRFALRELKLARAIADISAAAIQNARLYASTLQRERRHEVVGQVLAAINSTIDVDQVPRQLVDVLLRAFGADRAWLLYPCDPTVESVLVPYEATTPAYPGANRLNLALPTSAVGYLLGRALRTDGPVAVDLSDPDAPEALVALLRRAQIQSILAVRFQPRDDRPWLMGLHQCRYRRTWTAEEAATLAEIAGYAAVAIEHAQLHEQMSQALRIREEFVSAAAHELKTPATALKGYAQLLLRTACPSADDLSTRALKAIDQSVNRITRLTHDLLEVTSLEIGELGLRRSEFDLAELAHSVVSDARLVAGGREVSCQAPVPTLISADRERIADVLFGLVDNAVKHSPYGAPVEVSVDARDGEAVLSVRDHGPGIPRERWPHLFEPLYEPHPVGGVGYVGVVGLGLYLARRVVERHGGRIWLDSTEGEGSTFSLALPLLSTAAPSSP